MNWINEIYGKRWNLTPCLRMEAGGTMQQFVLDPDYPQDLRRGKWIGISLNPKVGIFVEGVLQPEDVLRGEEW